MTYREAVRMTMTTIMAGSMGLILGVGLTGEEMARGSAQALREKTAEMQQLAVYAGCADVDQVGNFAWHRFPVAMDDDTGEPIRVKATKRKGTHR